MSTTSRNLFTLEDYDSIVGSYTTQEGRMAFLIGKGYTDKEIGEFLGKRPQHVNHVRNRGSADAIHERRMAEYRKSQDASKSEVATVIKKEDVAKK